MKTCSLTLVFKIVLFAVAAIVLCVLCGVALAASNSGKAMVDGSTAQINKIASKNGDLTLAQYEGNAVLGSEVVALINDTIENKNHLSVVVETLQGSRTDYSYIYDEVTKSIAVGGSTTIQKSKAQVNYINRDSLFQCEVKKDDNGNIICLWFEQK